MNCPQCQSPAVKKGSYLRPSDKKSVQRYFCKACKKSFSDQTFNFDYRLRKRSHNQMIFRLLCSGQSQRRCALIFNMKPEAIARRVTRFSAVAEKNLEIFRKSKQKPKCVYIDEMESFEHSKCKPLTIPIAVEDKTRKILALSIGQIAAKGHLAEISRKKYGHRRCRRTESLNQVFRQLKQCCEIDIKIKSDESVHYPKKIKRFFPKARHDRFKGRRGCVTGQGELKAKGFDPLFCLNHTCAMIRDNLKTLSRRTWCTTKKIKRLHQLLYIYAWFHNLYIDNPKKIYLRSLAISN